MMLLPVPLQARLHLRAAAFQNLRVALRGQRFRIAFAGEDGLDDPQPAEPVKLADHGVEAHIHAIKGPLQVGHAHRRLLEMILAQPCVGPQRAHFLRRDEVRPQEPVAEEHRVPLAVGEVALLARQIARMCTVEEQRRKARAMQLVVDGDPIDARGLESHTAHAVGGEPRAEPAQFCGRGSKDRDRRIGRGGVNARRAQIERGKAWKDRVELFSCPRRFATV